MASIYEIMDLAVLWYDPIRGFKGTGDAGQGPPPNEFGWVRGAFSTTNPAGEPGLPSCLGWTTAAAGQGPVVWLDSDWTTTPASTLGPWTPFNLACSGSRRVWCVED